MPKWSTSRKSSTKRQKPLPAKVQRLHLLSGATYGRNVASSCTVSITKIANNQQEQHPILDIILHHPLVLHNCSIDVQVLHFPELFSLLSSTVLYGNFSIFVKLASYDAQARRGRLTRKGQPSFSKESYLIIVERKTHEYISLYSKAAPLAKMVQLFLPNC